MKTPAMILRLEVYEKDDKLVYIAERPLFSKNQKVVKAMHTRLINWAMQQYPDWCEVKVRNSMFEQW